VARPLPVNLLLAGTGAVLLVSGIGGKSIGDVLKGQFGNLDVKNPNIGSEHEQSQVAGAAAGTGGGSVGGTGPASVPGGGASAPSPTTFSHATFAPSPTSFINPRHRPTKQQQARSIAMILASEGIFHPTRAQLIAARKKYENETGVKQFGTVGEGAEEFVGGLPVV